MALSIRFDPVDIEFETEAALDELEKSAPEDATAQGCVERVRALLDRIEKRAVEWPVDARGNAEDIREARRILFAADFPRRMNHVKLSLLHRLWQWEQFLR